MLKKYLLSNKEFNLTKLHSNFIKKSTLLLCLTVVTLGTLTIFTQEAEAQERDFCYEVGVCGVIWVDQTEFEVEVGERFTIYTHFQLYKGQDTVFIGMPDESLRSPSIKVIGGERSAVYLDLNGINQVDAAITLEATEAGSFKTSVVVSPDENRRIWNVFYQPINIIVNESNKEKDVPIPPVITPPNNEEPTNGESGGCLIATATFGSELAPQVQQLRELRDNTILETSSGMTFMTTFNQFYYSFSPIIADFEREQPIFKEVMKLTLTPMLSSLSLLSYVDIDSEQEMLGYGISIVLLNIGMYVGIPLFGILKLYQFRKN